MPHFEDKNFDYKLCIEFIDFIQRNCSSYLGIESIVYSYYLLILNNIHLHIQNNSFDLKRYYKYSLSNQNCNFGKEDYYQQDLHMLLKDIQYMLYYFYNLSIAIDKDNIFHLTYKILQDTLNKNQYYPNRQHNYNHKKCKYYFQRNTQKDSQCILKCLKHIIYSCLLCMVYISLRFVNSNQQNIKCNCFDLGKFGSYFNIEYRPHQIKNNLINMINMQYFDYQYLLNTINSFPHKSYSLSKYQIYQYIQAHTEGSMKYLGNQSILMFIGRALQMINNYFALYLLFNRFVMFNYIDNLFNKAYNHNNLCITNNFQYISCIYLIIRLNKSLINIIDNFRQHCNLLFVDEIRRTKP